jgi:hypothetical protein
MRQRWVIARLQDSASFRNFSILPELRAFTWSNGVDFANEFLYEKTQVSA